jgi:hypothetical protein
LKTSGKAAEKLEKERFKKIAVDIKKYKKFTGKL